MITDSTENIRIISQNRKIERSLEPSIPHGIARTKKIIRTERSKEIQFMKLCSQIKLKDKKKERADNQRNERKQKRKQKISSDSV